MFQELEKYSIVRKIGEGSFGFSYLATQKSDDTSCVFKISQKALSDVDKALFHREIEIILKLTHPSILRVLDSGFIDDNAFIVTEYMDGGTLEDKIQLEGQLALSYVIDLGILIAGTLDFLNKQKIVHRDIKPSNIFIATNDIYKLGDFGLAKNTENAGKSGITAPGMGRGTLEYTPLEQLENAVFADTRSDLYSLGATMYEAVCGHPPHHGQSTVEILTSIYRGKIEVLRLIRPETPKSLSNIVEKLLSQDPRNRFQKPIELQKALKAIKTDSRG